MDNAFRIRVLARDYFSCAFCGQSVGGCYEGKTWLNVIPLTKDAELGSYIVDEWASVCQVCYAGISEFKKRYFDEYEDRLQNLAWMFEKTRLNEEKFREDIREHQLNEIRGEKNAATKKRV